MGYTGTSNRGPWRPWKHGGHVSGAGVQRLNRLPLLCQPLRIPTKLSCQSKDRLVSGYQWELASDTLLELLTADSLDNPQPRKIRSGDHLTFIISSTLSQLYINIIHEQIDNRTKIFMYIWNHMIYALYYFYASIFIQWYLTTSQEVKLSVGWPKATQPCTKSLLMALDHLLIELRVALATWVMANDWQSHQITFSQSSHSVPHLVIQSVSRGVISFSHSSCHSVNHSVKHVKHIFSQNEWLHHP